MAVQNEQAKANQGKKAKKATIDDILAKKKPVTKVVSIQMDGGVANEIAHLRQQYSIARESDRHRNEPDEAPKIQEQIDKLIADSQDTVVDFHFRSIGRHAYDKMVLGHPPTAAQKKEGAQFNADTFPPALVAASCVEPEMSLEQATAMFDSPDWNGAELRDLFFGALEVNTETGEIPLSRTGSDATLSSLLNLASASSRESLTPSM